MNAYLRGVESHLPERILDNAALVAQNPGWDADAIFKKTGIRERRIAAPGETAADLGTIAAERLLARTDVDRDEIDALLFCTQSPDRFLPTTACTIQPRLELGTHCGAFDFNLGCSGFTYGLWVARGLIVSGSARNVLLVTADTYSKFCDPHDLATVTIFGDAGAAALIGRDDAGALAEVGQTVVGTDGRGAENLIVRGGACREPAGDRSLYMNGPEIFSFTLGSVKAGIARLLEQTGTDWKSVDRYLFHQANRFMLDNLRRTMKIPVEKMPIDLEDTGNTVSASIPLLMTRELERGNLKAGQSCVLAGFGVGYSWAMSALRWR